jgi:hypothetical protein
MHFIGKISSKENIKMQTAANARLNQELLGIVPFESIIKK